MTVLEDSPAWQKLEQYGEDAQHISISDLFERSPKRADDFALTCDGLYFDYAKTSITEKARKSLYALAKAQNIQDKFLH